MALGLVFFLTGSALAVEGNQTLAAFSRNHLTASDSEGAELYQRWCSTCHGDRGQGLTEAWRATWPEDKQNCWQSKCHAGNHPPDGFSFPKIVPALVGRAALTKFNTAQDLYVYSRVAMPYWAPNLLSDEEYLAITTFLVEANYAEQNRVLPEPFPRDLTAIPIHPRAEAEEPLTREAETLTAFLPWGALIGLTLLLLGLGGWLGYRAKMRTQSWN